MKLAVYCDASFDRHYKIAALAYFVLTDVETPKLPDDEIKSTLIQSTSSAVSEVQALLWAIQQCRLRYPKIDRFCFYTDHRSLTNLAMRRSGIEKKQTLANSLYSKYRELAVLLDQIHYEFIWTRGHRPTNTRNLNESIFHLVDKAARKYLRSSRKNIQA